MKSRNAFPGMLRLLIGEGDRVAAREPAPSPEDPKIVFEKTPALSASTTTGRIP